MMKYINIYYIPNIIHIYVQITNALMSIYLILPIYVIRVQYLMYNIFINNTVKKE